MRYYRVLGIKETLKNLYYKGVYVGSLKANKWL